MLSAPLIVTIALTAYLFAYITIRAVRRFPSRYFVDIPNERSSHVQPTMRGGGVGIVATVFIFVVTAPFNHDLLPFYIGAMVIALIGFIDDRWSLSAQIRLPIHFIVAGVIVYTYLPSFTNFLALAIGFLLSIIWIAGLTNAYNFMDGIDGIAGSQAVLAGLGWLIIGINLNLPHITSLAIVLTSASLGFLAHNWPPARIFMGDVGSTFLGFSFGGLTLYIAQYSLLASLVSVLFIWPFIFDTTLTLFRRIKNRENILQAHRSHLYQRLNSLNYTHPQITTLYLVLATLGVLCGTLSLYNIFTWRVAYAIVLFLAIGLWQITRSLERKSIT